MALTDLDIARRAASVGSERAKSAAAEGVRFGATGGVGRERWCRF
ncbi:hypothetical protein ACFORO_17775 [Amycolatopsis halotolerans]|uniref:Uncharacterized protein n=1 Tax=Amycolatopsis halotolerans TaxID=330083 RepID=A0ABV7QIN4_9PSEU